MWRRRFRSQQDDAPAADGSTPASIAQTLHRSVSPGGRTTAVRASPASTPLGPRHRPRPSAGNVSSRPACRRPGSVITVLVVQPISGPCLLTGLIVPPHATPIDVSPYLHRPGQGCGGWQHPDHHAPASRLTCGCRHCHLARPYARLCQTQASPIHGSRLGELAGGHLATRPSCARPTTAPGPACAGPRPLSGDGVYCGDAC